MKKPSRPYPFSGYMAEPFCGAMDSDPQDAGDRAHQASGGGKPLTRFPLWFFAGFLSFVAFATVVAR